MPIQFGHVKAVFVKKEGGNSVVLLQASSGMYVLKFEHVAPEFKKTHKLFIKRVLQ